MIRFVNKFVAVLLAIWLPLFSGNALAVSVAMQAMSGDCQTMQTMPASHQHMHHMQMTADQDQADANSVPQNNLQDPQNSDHKNCSVCQVACCGFMAAGAIKVADAQPSSRSYLLSATQFQSISSAPLVPPPLVRAQRGTRLQVLP